MPPSIQQPATPFRVGSLDAGFSVGEFWQWAASDLLSNTMRGLVAEFIVARALGLGSVCREEWTPCDLVTSAGIKIEVKSAARRQSWHQKRPSLIRFRIAPTRAWDSVTNASEAEARRQAHIYIFCLLENEPPVAADPLDLERWTFYVLPASVLNEHCPTRKSIGLSSLLRLTPTQTSFFTLASAVQKVSQNEKHCSKTTGR